MIFISEWLPNPAGKDSDGEWLELFNDGGAAVSLSGWYVTTGGETKHKLSGTIGAGEYRVFPRSEVKASLTNTDGKLFLYGASGELEHKGIFIGSAPEGKTVSKLGSGFFFTEPTPGSENTQALPAGVEGALYSDGAQLANISGAIDVWGIMLGVAVGISALILYATKQNKNLSELFFSND